MKLRFLIVALMVTMIANMAFAGGIYWTQDSNEAVADWGEVDAYGDALYWWIEDEAGDYQSADLPLGTIELKVYGENSVVTVDTDCAFTDYYSNRARVYGGATVNIVDGGNLEGFGWLRVGEGSKAGESTINQSGGMFNFANGWRTGKRSDGGPVAFSEWDCKDEAGLTLGDGGGGPDAHGIYSISGGTLTYFDHYEPGFEDETKQATMRIGDRTGEGTFIVTGTGGTILFDDLQIGGRLGKDESRAGTGNVIFNLEADGVSAMGFVDNVCVRSYISSGSNLDVNMTTTLDDQYTDIVLVDNQGTAAVVGEFITFNGGYATEGSWQDIDPGVGVFMAELTYVGGTGNDIVLLIPEPATLALLSLGMFIIRRKK